MVFTMQSLKLPRSQLTFCYHSVALLSTLGLLWLVCFLPESCSTLALCQVLALCPRPRTIFSLAQGFSKKTGPSLGQGNRVIFTLLATFKFEIISKWKSFSKMKEKVIPRPWTWASPGNLLEMPILRPFPKSTESELWAPHPTPCTAVCFTNKLFQVILMHEIKFENHWLSLTEACCLRLMWSYAALFMIMCFEFEDISQHLEYFPGGWAREALHQWESPEVRTWRKGNGNGNGQLHKEKGGKRRSTWGVTRNLQRDSPILSWFSRFK